MAIRSFSPLLAALSFALTIAIVAVAVSAYPTGLTWVEAVASDSSRGFKQMAVDADGTYIIVAAANSRDVVKFTLGPLTYDSKYHLKAHRRDVAVQAVAIADDKIYLGVQGIASIVVLDSTLTFVAAIRLHHSEAYPTSLITDAMTGATALYVTLSHYPHPRLVRVDLTADPAEREDSYTPLYLNTDMVASYYDAVGSSLYVGYASAPTTIDKIDTTSSPAAFDDRVEIHQFWRAQYGDSKYFGLTGDATGTFLYISTNSAPVIVAKLTMSPFEEVMRSATRLAWGEDYSRSIVSINDDLFVTTSGQNAGLVRVSAAERRLEEVESVAADGSFSSPHSCVSVTVDVTTDLYCASRDYSQEGDSILHWQYVAPVSATATLAGSGSGSGVNAVGDQTGQPSH